MAGFLEILKQKGVAQGGKDADDVQGVAPWLRQNSCHPDWRSSLSFIAILHEGICPHCYPCHIMSD